MRGGKKGVEFAETDSYELLALDKGRVGESLIAIIVLHGVIVGE